MNLLSPFTALFAAAVAIPALLLLYFFKLRRRHLRVASTLLWQHAFEDLEVNAPFQRLKWSSLLVLQLLTLLALLAALAQPIAQGEPHRASRLILVIDRSASMSARDAGDGLSRLEAAKNAAKEAIDRLTRGAAAREVMIIAYGSQPHVVSTFQFDRRTLVAAIDAIEPTHEEANLSGALQLAAGFAGHSEAAGDQAAEIILFSDGVVEQPDDPAGFRLRAGSFRFVQVVPENQPVSNLGFTSFSARRDLDDPSRVLLFARLVNAGSEADETLVTLHVNNERAATRRMTVPPAEAEGVIGETSLTFAVDLPRGGVLSIAHGYRDSLDADDHAFLVMPPPARPRFAVVHGELADREFLHRLLENFDPDLFNIYSPEGFAELDRRDLDSGVIYDLIVFDRVSGHRLPGVPSITFGGRPLGVDERDPRTPGGKRVLSWDRQHPIMRQVSLDAVAFSDFGAYELPPGATSLASGPDGTIIALVATRGTRHVMVGFPLDLSRTNWPLHVSVAVFMQNVMEYLTLAGSGQVGLVQRPGEAIAVRARPDVDRLSIVPRSDSQDTTVEIAVEPGTMRTLPALRRAGVYQVAGAVAPMDTIAVSMLSERESDIRPRSRLTVNAQPAVAGTADEAVPRELWPWVLAAALFLLFIEWLAYCRKAR